MKIGLGFGALALLLLLPDLYIFFGVIGDAAWWLKLVFWLPTAFYVWLVSATFFIGSFTQRRINLVFGLTLCLVFPTILFALISLIGKFIGLFAPSVPIVFNWIALGFAGVWIAGSLYGLIFGWRRVSVDRLRLYFPNLPENFDGYKIVQLSDLHLGTYAAAPATVGKIVDMVNALAPDLIVFTGDLVNSSPEEAVFFLKELASLKAKDGVYSVLGNHDYCFYRKYAASDTPWKARRRLMEYERQAGWQLLMNESVEIKRGNERIALLGVENAGSKPYLDKSDLKKALDGVGRDVFKILLSHDPSQWRREVVGASDIDLALSGHTHAMQFKIGKFSPSKWLFPEWGGVYRKGRQILVVNTGTGGNVTFRFGAYPQILEIVLERGEVQGASNVDFYGGD